MGVFKQDKWPTGEAAFVFILHLHAVVGLTGTQGREVVWKEVKGSGASMLSRLLKDCLEKMATEALTAAQ